MEYTYSAPGAFFLLVPYLWFRRSCIPGHCHRIPPSTPKPNSDRWSTVLSVKLQMNWVVLIFSACFMKNKSVHQWLNGIGSLSIEIWKFCIIRKYRTPGLRTLFLNYILLHRWVFHLLFFIRWNEWYQPGKTSIEWNVQYLTGYEQMEIHL